VVRILLLFGDSLFRAVLSHSRSVWPVLG